jgi:hypothetical protein
MPLYMVASKCMRNKGAEGTNLWIPYKAHKKYIPNQRIDPNCAPSHTQAVVCLSNWSPNAIVSLVCSLCAACYGTELDNCVRGADLTLLCQHLKVPSSLACLASCPAASCPASSLEAPSCRASSSSLAYLRSSSAD